MMKENFWKRGGRRLVLIFAVLLFCGGLAFLLSELLPKYAPPDETEPTESEIMNVLPEGADYWIKEIEGEVTLKDGVMTLKFGNHTVNLSDFDWYRRTDEKGRTIQYQVDGLKGKEAVCEAGFPWSEDLLLSGMATTGTQLWKVCTGGLECDYQVSQAAYETYLSDLDAGKWNPTKLIGVKLYYWVAEEHRLYEVKTLMTKAEFDFIARNATGEYVDGARELDKQIYNRIWYFRYTEFIYVQAKNYVHEGHVHCAYDNYRHLTDIEIEKFLKE